MILRRSAAEFIGTGLLLAAIVGSGIMAQRLSPTDIGLELLENDAATACALVAIILAVGPVSGAHLNPVITLVDRFFGGLTTKLALAYIGAQVSGGIVGTVLANLTFFDVGGELLEQNEERRGPVAGRDHSHVRPRLVVFGVVRAGRASIAPFAVGAYIGAAYFFTASTSFANPAVTIARMFSDTFAGISPGSAPVFILTQALGGAIAVLAIKALFPTISQVAGQVVVSRSDRSAEEVAQ